MNILVTGHRIVDRTFLNHLSQKPSSTGIDNFLTVSLKIYLILSILNLNSLRI